MKPKSSPIWNYFVEIDNSSAKCKVCEKVYSRKGRTTTALKSHLNSIHAEHFAEFEKLNDVKHNGSLETKKEMVQSKQLRRILANLKQCHKEVTKEQQSMAVKVEPTTRTIYEPSESSNSEQNGDPLDAVYGEENSNDSDTFAVFTIPNKGLDKEYRDSKMRSYKLHDLQKELYLERIREARAKADLAELLLKRERAEDT